MSRAKRAWMEIMRALSIASTGRLGSTGVYQGGVQSSTTIRGGPRVDGAPYRHVVDHTSVDVSLVVDLDRRKDGRDRRGGQHRLYRRSVGEPALAAVGQRGGHHLHGYGRVLESVEVDSLDHDLAQTGVGVHGVALLEVEPGSVQAPLGIDGVAGQTDPDLGHAFDPAAGRVTGEGHPVDGAHRGAVDPVGNESVFGQDLEHPDLDGAPGAATPENQRGHLSGTLVVVLFRRQPGRPGDRRPLQGEPDDEYQQDDGGYHEHGKDHGEGGDRSRRHQWERLPGLPLPAGSVTPLLHTDPMEVVDVDRAVEHQGFSGAAPGIRVPGSPGRIEGPGPDVGPYPGRAEPRPGGAEPQRIGVSPPPIGRSTRWRDHDWQPLSGDALLERLRITGRPRPKPDPELVVALRRGLESGLAEDVDSGESPPRTDGRAAVDGPHGAAPLVVTKDKLTRVLACEAHYIATEFGERTPTVAMACGAMVDALFRQLVTVGSIDEPVVDALAALAVDDRQQDLVGWINQLSGPERDELHAEVERQAGGIVRRWPALDPGWLPRTQEALRVVLANGAVELSARVDLAIGRPVDDQASVAIVEVKSGVRRVEHRTDLHFYALIESLRNPAPPFVVATYYTRTGELDVDPVSEDLLVAAARRTLTGIRLLRDLAAGADPSRTANGMCGLCAALPDCGVGQRHVSGMHRRAGGEHR